MWKMWIISWPLSFLVFLFIKVCKTEDSDLAYIAKCIIDDEEFQCSAAQWSDGGGPSELEVMGGSVSLTQSESCGLKYFSHDPLPWSMTVAEQRDTQEVLALESIPPLIAITPRGGCSFATKAITAQKLGFRSLIIVDSDHKQIFDDESHQAIEAPHPPGLGAESTQISILVVMMFQAPWNIRLFESDKINSKLSVADDMPKSKTSTLGSQIVFNKKSTSSVHLRFSRPNEADLWLSSPWYGTNLNQSSLSLTKSGERYTLRCDLESVEKVSDDKWLYAQWLEEMERDKHPEFCSQLLKESNLLDIEKESDRIHDIDGNNGGGCSDSKDGSARDGKSKGCLEIRNLKPRFDLTEPLNHEQIIKSIRLLFNQTSPLNTIAIQHEDEKDVKKSAMGGVVLFRMQHWDSYEEPMNDIRVVDGLTPSTGVATNMASGSRGATAGASSLFDSAKHSVESSYQEFDKSKEEEEEEEEVSKSSNNVGSEAHLRLLRGLNSNSHKFPWNGLNKYPRLFEAGSLVVKHGCVRRDGVIVRHQANDISSSPSSSSSSSSDVMSEVAEYHYGGCGCCPSGHGELGNTFAVHEETNLSMEYDKVVVLIQRYHHVYYHFILEMMGRLLQVLPLLQADEDFKVLVDTSNSFVRQVLVDIVGLKPSQILSHRRGVSVCSKILVVPAPVPCGHMPKNLSIALRKFYINQLHEMNVEFRSMYQCQLKLSHNNQVDFRISLKYNESIREYMIDVDGNEQHKNIGESDIESGNKKSSVDIEKHQTSTMKNQSSDHHTLSQCMPEHITTALFEERRPLILVLKRLGSRSVLNHQEMFDSIKNTFSSSSSSSSFASSNEYKAAFASYQVFEFEASALSVTCQAVWLQACSIFIAPHGSGLSNAIFLPEQSLFSSLSSQPSLIPKDNTNDAKVSPHVLSWKSNEPIVIELLPWEYPNLTFYLSLIWFPIKHIMFTVKGNAYGAMEVDVPKLIGAIKNAISRSMEA